MVDRLFHRQRLTIIAIYAVGTLFLSLAAIYNRFPLVYPDSGSYLRAFIEWHNLDERPIFYSIFLSSLHWRLNLWPIVIGQSLLTVFTIERTVTHLAPRAGVIAKLILLSILALGTSLPWFTGQIMADFFAPIMVLATYLAVVERNQLTKLEYFALLGILWIAQASHYTHVTLTLGLLVFLTVCSVILGIPKFRNIVPAALTSALAIVAVMTVNLGARHEITFTPYGSIFIVARLIGYGTLQDYLTRHCSSEHYAICRYLDKVIQHTGDTNWLLWHNDSVLDKLGGAEGFKTEADRLARAVILDAPGKHLHLLVDAAVRQFFNFGTGRELPRLGAGMQIYRVVTTYFPSEADAYRHSRQYLGGLDLDLVNRIDMPVAYGSLIGLIVLLGLGTVKRDTEFVVFVSIILLALIGNGILCGGLSSGEARYQSRLIPLAPLAVGLGILRMRSRSPPL